MARRDLRWTLFNDMCEHYYIHYQRFWDLVDSFKPDERQLIRLLWQEDFQPTDLTIAEALRQTGCKQGTLDRALRRLRHPWRYKYYLLRSMPSIEYGYA